MKKPNTLAEARRIDLNFARMLLRRLTRPLPQSLRRCRRARARTEQIELEEEI